MTSPSRPNGAGAHPALGIAQGSEARVGGSRPNGPTVPCGESLARWAESEIAVPRSPGRYPGLEQRLGLRPDHCRQAGNKIILSGYDKWLRPGFDALT